MKTVEELLETAISELSNLIKGEGFIVKELFKGYEWKRYPIKNRLLLGTLFFNEVNKGTVQVSSLGKTSSGQQKYQKD